MTAPDFSKPHSDYRFEDSQGRRFKTFREFLNFHLSPHPMMDWSVWFTQLSDAIIAWQDRPEPEHLPPEPTEFCGHARAQYDGGYDQYICPDCGARRDNIGEDRERAIRWNRL